MVKSPVAYSVRVPGWYASRSFRISRYALSRSAKWVVS